MNTLIMDETTNCVDNLTYGSAMARRRGNPLICQHIWDALIYAKANHKSATADYIRRHCSMNSKISPEDVDEQLKFLVQDGLILQNPASTAKATSHGTETTFYSIPKESDFDAKSSHDWYCFACHKPGEVVTCFTCSRVYHPKCLEAGSEYRKQFVCPVCKEISSQSDEDWERAEINLLLSYACARIQKNLPYDLTVWKPLPIATKDATQIPTERCAAIMNKCSDFSFRQGGGGALSRHGTTEGSEQWRAKFLLHQPVDLLKMDSKADRQVYRSPGQFQADAATIVHNVSIFHGEHSPLADAARVMLRDCVHELSEIKLCSDCYRRSNEQQTEGWFCEPCDPPHELVYAKARGYPYWPAKVMSIKDNAYDVRFFGSGHDRATLDKAYVRPIDTDITKLGIKRRTSWLKAMEELEKHKKLLVEYENAKDSEDESESPMSSILEEEQAEICMTSAGEHFPHPRKELFVKLRRIPLPPNGNLAIRAGKSRNTAIRSKPFLTAKVSITGKVTTPVTDNQASSLVSAVPSEVENDSNECLDFVNAVGTSENEIDTLMQGHSVEMKVLKKESRQSNEGCSEASQAGSVPEENESSDERVEALKKTHAAEMQSLKATLEKTHAAEIKSLKAIHQQQLDNQSRSWKKTKEEMLRTIDIQKKALERAEKDSEQELMELKSSYEATIEALKVEHEKEIAATKTKPWCMQCGKQGVLHCCINVSYCSTDCQKKHWDMGHKSVCRHERSRIAEKNKKRTQNT